MFNSNWINSEKWNDIRNLLPENGQKVLLLMVHWKENFPGSWELYGTEFIEGSDRYTPYFLNNDDIGHGGQVWKLDESAVECETGYYMAGTRCFWLDEEGAREFLPYPKEGGG